MPRNVHAPHPNVVRVTSSRNPRCTSAVLLRFPIAPFRRVHAAAPLKRLEACATELRLRAFRRVHLGALAFRQSDDFGTD